MRFPGATARRRETAIDHVEPVRAHVHVVAALVTHRAGVIAVRAVGRVRLAASRAAGAMRFVFLGPHRIETRDDAGRGRRITFALVLRVAVANGGRSFFPSLVGYVRRFVGRCLLVDARVDVGARPNRERGVSLRCAQAVDLVDACRALGAESVGRCDRRNVRAASGIYDGASAVDRRRRSGIDVGRASGIVGRRSAVVVRCSRVVVRETVVRRRATAGSSSENDSRNAGVFDEARCDNHAFTLAELLLQTSRYGDVFAWSALTR